MITLSEQKQVIIELTKRIFLAMKISFDFIIYYVKEIIKSR